MSNTHKKKIFCIYFIILIIIRLLFKTLCWRSDKLVMYVYKDQAKI